MLEHHGDAGDRLGDARLVHPDFTGIDGEQAVDATKHRGLAAAGRTDHRDDLALADIEVDVAEDFERAVMLAEAFYADARLRRGRCGARERGGSWAHSAACDAGFGATLAQ